MIEPLLQGVLWRFFRTFHLLEIEGEQHVPPSGPVIVACNHINYFDPFIIQLGVARKIRFVAWVRGFVHVYGWFMRRMGTIPIDLSKPDRRAYETVLGVLRAGGVIGIFPEGTFTPDGHVVHPKVGAARMAIETGAVIVPATLTGAFRVWAPHVQGRSGGHLFPRPGKITLKFHPPVLLDPQERVSREHDKEYHRQVIDQVMAPVIRRVEPSLRAEQRVEELVKAPASHIRIYEWLPLIAIVVGAFFMRWRQVWDARLLAAAALAYGVYFCYVLADIRWMPQNRRTKFLRNIVAPLLLLMAMFPTLFEMVTRLRAAVGDDYVVAADLWDKAAPFVKGVTWPFGAMLGRALADWWTLTYCFPLVYIGTSLWAYYFSHYLQFQKLVRGLLLSFYAGLLLIILVPPLGRAHGIHIPEGQLGGIASWVYTSSPFAGWRIFDFPGFFILIAVYLWLFDLRHRLPARAAWYAPWVMNLILACLLLRGLSWSDALTFGLLGWLVITYLGAVKFLAHDGRWV